MNNDLISRSALREEIIKKRGLSWESMQHIFCITAEELDNAPTVETEKPQGEWIYERPNGKTYSDFVYCSECQKPNGFYKTDFCPNCGADMRGDKE